MNDSATWQRATALVQCIVQNAANVDGLNSGFDLDSAEAISTVWNALDV
jgi:hypothetical protein